MHPAGCKFSKGRRFYSTRERLCCHVKLSCYSGSSGRRDALADLSMVMVSLAQMLRPDLKDHHGSQPLQRMVLAQNIRSVEGGSEDIKVADNSTEPARIKVPVAS